MDSYSANFVMFFGFFHVVLSICAWMALRQFTLFYLYRKGRLDPASMEFKYLDGKAWWAPNFLVTMFSNAYILICAIAYFGFGLGWAGAHIDRPLHLGFAPDITNWPNPMYVLGSAILLLIIGNALIMKKRIRLGSWIALCSALPLLALFFYAYPLV